MQSLRTGLRILTEFSHVSGELTVTEMANRLQMSKSQVSRMFAAFREEGWLVQNPTTRGFSIGISAYAAGARFINSNRLTREALPILRSMVDRCGFTSTLSVLDGVAPLYLLGLEGPVSVDFASRVGSYFPFHATAPGKLLAAFADEPTRLAMLRTELRPVTPRTVVDLPALRKELREVRERGYAVGIEERIPGIGGVAVPIFDAQENCVGALATTYPVQLVPPERFAYYAAILHAGARTLSQRMGADAYPFEGEAWAPQQPLAPSKA